MDMSTSEESTTSESSSHGSELMDWVSASALLTQLKFLLDNQSIPVNPRPKLSGAYWMQQVLSNPTACKDNLRMSRDAFMHLHDMLLPYGLPTTDKCGSIEALGMYVWTCAHQSAVRECKYRFERSLDTISRKVSQIAYVMFQWAQTMLVPPDQHYRGVSKKLMKYEPWFDGCIGAIDGTHIEVEVNRAAKVDFFNRNGDTSINVCVIVNMDGQFTWVGAGKAGACHDQAVLDDCKRDPRFPHPPPGRYYLGDSGYTLADGYLTPYRHTRFGVLKERWHILEKVPYFSREKQAWMIISCFALDNYLWRRKYGEHPPTYPVSDWVAANVNTSIEVVREWIATVVWGEPVDD